MLKRWASQALSPVTLMITLLLSSLKSSAKVQLIIDIDKEKGIYLLKIRFSCNIISKRKRPCELSQSRFRILQYVSVFFLAISLLKTRILEWAAEPSESQHFFTLCNHILERYTRRANKVTMMVRSHDKLFSSRTHAG